VTDSRDFQQTDFPKKRLPVGAGDALFRAFSTPKFTLE
jgi:hypothetical protein